MHRRKHGADCRPSSQQVGSAFWEGAEPEVAEFGGDVTANLLDGIRARLGIQRRKALDFSTFRKRVGTSYRLVRLACEHYGPGDEFTLGELAERSGMPHASLQSDLMNMGRTAHSLGGSIDDILPSRKGSGG